MTSKPYTSPTLEPIGRVRDLTATFTEADFFHEGGGPPNDGSDMALVAPGDGVDLHDSPFGSQA